MVSELDSFMLTWFEASLGYLKYQCNSIFLDESALIINCLSIKPSGRIYPVISGEMHRTLQQHGHKQSCDLPGVGRNLYEATY